MTVGKFVAAVLVSAGRHPFTGTPRACRGDAVAIALGQRIVGDALRIIHAGAIDEPALKPTAHMFVGSKASWHEILDHLPQHDEYPWS